MTRALVIACAIAGGCSGQRTEVVLVVSESGLIAGSDYDNVRLRVLSPPAADPTTPTPDPNSVRTDRNLHVCNSDGVQPCFELPISATLIPGAASPDDSVAVLVEATLRGQPRISDAAVFAFARGQSERLDIVLYGTCLDTNCAQRNQACVADGSCQTVKPIVVAGDPTVDASPAPPPDLRGADLSTVDLASGDLAGADFAGADFATPRDFAAPNDFSKPNDFGSPSDFSSPFDFSRPNDLSTGDMPCVPDCSGRVCGPDLNNCGVSCGVCAAGVCTANGQCLTSCGGKDASCSDPSDCCSNLSCYNFQCEPCGNLGQPCCGPGVDDFCASGVCDERELCSSSCGNTGELCCVNDVCNNAPFDQCISTGSIPTCEPVDMGMPMDGPSTGGPDGPSTTCDFFGAPCCSGTCTGGFTCCMQAGCTSDLGSVSGGFCF